MKRPGTLPRRTRLSSGSGLTRSSRIARKARIRPRNPKRRKSEFARTYGSRERVRFVKSLACVFCTMLSPFVGLAMVGKSENAHTVSGGKGRKADYDTITALCRQHHRMYDEYVAPLDQPAVREAIKATCAEVERRWQDHLNRNAA
jgi:hypothetical protein